jgi:transposase
MKNRIDIDEIRTYTDGRMQFMVGLCEKVGLPQVFDEHMIKETGRPREITPGVEAMIMMALMSQEGYKPLYHMNDMFIEKDLEGIFHHPLMLEQINDDRFGYFLDEFHKAGCRKIFSTICTNALLTYGIKIGNINFDTTSYVMWGEYETVEGKTGAISIDFGHSKAKRPDKKQLKIGIGTANGTIVDAKVLSGNTDDKTYNKENIDDTNELLNRLNVDRNSFFYIADSALFTLKNIQKMNNPESSINFITRVPDNILIAKQLIEKGHGKNPKRVVYKNAHNKDVVYFVEDIAGEYEGNPLKFATIISEALIPTKTKTWEKKVIADEEKIKRIIKDYSNKKYACNKDAECELLILEEKVLSKFRFHTFSVSTKEIQKKRRGRPSLNESDEKCDFDYGLVITFEKDTSKLDEHIMRESTFILASNNLNITGEEMLLEYKTQSTVENKFKQLKDPHFVNSLYLEKPERIEALTYLILLTLMIMSVAETVVRQGLKAENETVIGTGGFVKKQPTLLMIFRIFENVLYQRISVNGVKIRKLLKPLNDCQKKIMRYLKLSESIFAYSGKSLI